MRVRKNLSLPFLIKKSFSLLIVGGVSAKLIKEMEVS
jgi:hypothetical protein